MHVKKYCPYTAGLPDAHSTSQQCPSGPDSERSQDCSAFDEALGICLRNSRKPFALRERPPGDAVTGGGQHTAKSSIEDVVELLTKPGRPEVTTETVQQAMLRFDDRVNAAVPLMVSALSTFTRTHCAELQAFPFKHRSAIAAMRMSRDPSIDSEWQDAKTLSDVHLPFAELVYKVARDNYFHRDMATGLPVLNTWRVPPARATDLAATSQRTAVSTMPANVASQQNQHSPLRHDSLTVPRPGADTDVHGSRISAPASSSCAPVVDDAHTDMPQEPLLLPCDPFPPQILLPYHDATTTNPEYAARAGMPHSADGAPASLPQWFTENVPNVSWGAGYVPHDSPCDPSGALDFGLDQAWSTAMPMEAFNSGAHADNILEYALDPSGPTNNHNVVAEQQMNDWFTADLSDMMGGVFDSDMFTGTMPANPDGMMPQSVPSTNHTEDVQSGVHNARSHSKTARRIRNRTPLRASGERRSIDESSCQPSRPRSVNDTPNLDGGQHGESGLRIPRRGRPRLSDLRRIARDTNPTSPLLDYSSAATPSTAPPLAAIPAATRHSLLENGRSPWDIASSLLTRGAVDKYLPKGDSARVQCLAELESLANEARASAQGSEPVVAHWEEAGQALKDALDLADEQNNTTVLDFINATMNTEQTGRSNERLQPWHELSMQGTRRQTLTQRTEAWQSSL